MKDLLYKITELSRLSGVSRQHIYSIKNGKTNASVLTLQKLAKVLNCDILEVSKKLNETENKEK